MREKPWLKSYDPPVPASLAPYPDEPLFSFLRRSAELYPQRACTIFRGRVITFREMDILSDRLAAALVHLGIRKGEPVGLLMPNSPQYVLAFFAVLKVGGVAVGVNPLYTAAELEYLLNDSGLSTMVVMSGFYARLKTVQPKTALKRLVVTNIKEYLPFSQALAFTLFKEKQGGHRVQLEPGDAWFQDLLKPPLQASGTLEAVKSAVKGSDPALIQYSGGTTGLPKGAVATHQNLVANTIQLRRWLFDRKDGEEGTVLALPMCHVYGLVVGMFLGVYAAATLVLVPDPRDMPGLLGSIQRYRPGIFPAVPTLFNGILRYMQAHPGKYDLSSIQVGVSGASSLRPDTKAAFEGLTGGKLIEGYGLSEAPSVTHVNPWQGENRPDSIGLPLPDVDCRVVSLEDGVTDLPPGKIGELLVSGPQVFQGYWRDPLATEETLVFEQASEKRWLCTGDIARMDADGYFYLLERKKEMIKAGGYQVLPREVEETLLKHPLVKDVCVAGVPDPYRGETVKAWVVLYPGENVGVEELKAFCREYLAPYKVPALVEFRESLPKSVLGKALRRVLVKEHLEGTVLESPGKS